MPDHHFSPALAQDHGVDAAVFLHNIYYWIKYNEAYKQNFHDGRYWTFNSLAALEETHPYWSRRQIERIVSACKKDGLLLTGNFNKDRRDRTTWYALSDRALTYFSDFTTKAVECIPPSGEMQITEEGKTFHHSVTALPDNSPSSSQTDTPQSPPDGGAGAKRHRRREAKAAPDWKPERFEGFWRMYPLKKSKQAAIRAWDSLHPDDKLLAVMGHALRRQLASQEWQRKLREEGGQGIPYPATWLNGRRWEDETGPGGGAHGGQAVSLTPERFGWD